MKNLDKEFYEFKKQLKSEILTLRNSRDGAVSSDQQGNISIGNEVVGFYFLNQGVLHFWFMTRTAGSPQNEPPSKSYRFTDSGWSDLSKENDIIDSTGLSRQFKRMLISGCEIAPIEKTLDEIKLERAWDLLDQKSFEEVDADQLAFMRERRLIQQSSTGWKATDGALMERLKHIPFPAHCTYDAWNLAFFFEKNQVAF